MQRLPMKRERNAARGAGLIRPSPSTWTTKARGESDEPIPVKLGPTYQIAIPGFLAEPRVRIAPRVQPRRAARPRELGEAEIVVLYNLALGLERGRPEDLISDAETARVARAVAGALQGHVRSVELAPVWDDLGAVLRRYDPARHVIFNLCESLGGRSWSEAEVPRLMRAGGFVHTGSSFLALRRAGNKLITKRTLVAADEELGDLTDAIVKPVAEHGSCGVSLASVVDDRQALGERIDECIRSYRQPALVEEFIDGRELNVALWGNGFPEVLPIAEIAFTWTDEPLQRIVTFSGKWHADSVEAVGTPGICPADLSQDDQDAVEAAAVLAYQKMGVRGFARVDMRLRDGTPLILEVNINPDLAEDAGFYRSARTAGHSYASMLLHILRLALASAT
jgi:D-alanine-D-alanine ligase